MLDGQRYSLQLSGEDPLGERRVLLSEELLAALKVIEREISQFICGAAAVDEADPVAMPGGGDDVAG